MIKKVFSYKGEIEDEYEQGFSALNIYRDKDKSIDNFVFINCFYPKNLDEEDAVVCVCLNKEEARRLAISILSELGKER